MSNHLVQSHALADYVEALPVMIWASGPDHGGVYFNRAWREFTGRTQKQLEGDAWMADVHPEDLPELKACAAAFADRRPFEIQFRLRRYDGVWRWMLDSANPRFDRHGSFVGFVGACTDITERKRAEEVLLNSEARLQLAQEAAGIGTYDWDVAGERITWSPQMFDLYGIDPTTPAQQIYSAWLERLHPEDRDEADAETRRFVAEAENLSISFRIVRPDGDVRWIEGRGRMIRDEGGQLLRMVGVNFDVTQARRGALALAESEQRLRSIAENFPGVIFQRVTYDDGRVEYPYFSGPDDAIFHIPRDQLREIKNVEDAAKLIHYDDVGSMLEKFRHSASALSTLDLEGRVIGPQGDERWVRSMSRPRRREDGALIWDGVLIDVTEQHLRESELERAAAKLRMGMEIAGIGTWELDPELRLLSGSAVTNELFGLGPEAGPLPLESYLSRIHPEDITQVRRNIDAAIASRTDVKNEYRLPQSDGSMRWIATRGAMVRLADGTERLIGALSDVTERRHREEEREAALKHQKMLLRELHHRVKNNLQMITSILRLQSSRVRDPDAKQFFTGSVERVQAISDLHVQLGFSGEPDTVDFGEHLVTVCKKLRHSVLEDSSIELSCDAESLTLPLDRALPLALIANELITNALKHAFPDGGSGRIRVALRKQEDGAIRLLIADSGMGLSSADRRDGLGMGLVRGLVQQVGGRLEIRSEPGAAFELVVASAA